VGAGGGGGEGNAGTRHTHTGGARSNCALGPWNTKHQAPSTKHQAPRAQKKSRYFEYIFRYKNGGCIERGYYAVSGPSGASDCRDSFVSRCRITPVRLGRSGSERRAFYRVTGADLANLANLRLRAEAHYSLERRGATTFHFRCTSRRQE
jgi:hypothetical protein